MAKYSVIIPVYNSEKTIANCIESITNTSFADYEIVIVNDGSSDKSDEICKEFAKRIPQIKYFYKENGGVSSARNFGLDNAEGKYILFVDSDDAVAENYFDELNEITESHDCEFYEFSYKLTDEKNEEIRKEADALYTDTATATDALCSAIVTRAINSPVTKVFLKSRIDALGLRFLSDIYIGEDQLFSVTYALGVKTFCTSSKILYVASLLNEDSLSRKKRDDLTEQIISGHRAMFCAIDNADIPEVARNKFKTAVTYSFYRSAYSASKEILKYDISNREKRKRIKRVLKSFCDENISVVGIKCLILATPVKLGMAFMIEKLFKARELIGAI